MAAKKKSARAKRKSPTVPLEGGRQARRREETRARLLRAALEVIATKGIGETRINDITEAADVGFGSFYNYFESKEAIHEALLGDAIERFGAHLDRIPELLEDPAEVCAASVRFTVTRALDDPAWGGFFLRTALMVQPVFASLGMRGIRDLNAGIESGRFRTARLEDTITAMGGIVLAFIARGLVEPEPTLPERAAVHALMLLGIEQSEAEAVATRPLPDIDAAEAPAAD